MEFNIGDIIRDNDKRMAGRQLVIMRLEAQYVFARNRWDILGAKPRLCRIRKDRIYDDFFRASGFTRIKHGTDPALATKGE